MVRWVGRGLAALVGVALVLLLAVLTAGWLGIAIGLGPLVPRIEAGVAEALGRPIEIGALSVVPSASPVVEIEGFVLESPPGFEEPLARVGRAGAQVSIAALLDGELRLSDLVLEGARVALAEKADGTNNFGDLGPRDDASAPGEGGPPSLGTAHVRLVDVEVSFVRADGSDPVALVIDEASGKLPAREPASLVARGSLRSAPGEVDLRAGSVDTLLSGETWPLAGEGCWGGVCGSLDGGIDDLGSFEGLHGAVRVHGERFAALGELFGFTPPVAGPFDATAQLDWRDGLVKLTDATGKAAGSDLAGALTITLGETVGLDGVARFGTLDLAPLLAVEERRIEAGEISAVSPTEAAADRSNETLDPGELVEIGRLRGLRGNVAIDAERVVGPGIEIPSLAGRLTLGDGRLGFGFASLADGGGTIEGALDASGETLRWQFDGHLPRVDLGRALTALGVEDAPTGDLSELSVVFDARGNTLSALSRTLEGSARAQRGHLVVSPVGETPHDLGLSQLVVDVQKGALAARTALTTEGVTSAVTLEVDRPLALLEDEPTPYRGAVRGPESRLSLSGELGTDRVTSSIDLEGERIGALAPLLGTSAAATASFRLRALATFDPDRWELAVREARLGRTHASGTLLDAYLEDPSDFTADLHFTTLDPDEIQSVFRPDDFEVVDDTKRRFTFDIPALPGQLDLREVDLRVRVDRLLDDLELEAIDFRARLVDAKSLRGSFVARLHEASLEGDASLEVGGAEPELRVEARARNFDGGRLFSDLGITHDVELFARDAQIRLVARGAVESRLFETMAFDSEVRDARVAVGNARTGDAAIVEVTRGHGTGRANEPLRVEFEGTIDDHPISLEIETGTLSQLAHGTGPVPLSTELAFEHGRLSLSAEAKLPLRLAEIDARLDATGDDLSEWGRLAGVDLPALGPFLIQADVVTDDGGYTLPGLRIDVGESSFVGGGRIATDGAVPRFEGFLYAPLVQLDDFEPESWAYPETAEAPQESEGESPVPVFASGVLDGFEATVSLEVDEVRSGADVLGAASGRALVRDGRMVAAPIVLEGEGGKVFAAWFWDPAPGHTVSELVIRAEKFEYGALARRLDPESEARGLLSLDVEMVADAPAGDELRAHANGHIDLAIWPQDLDAGAIDLWALNLLLSLLPVLDIRHSSVNCIVARFDVEDGVATHDQIIVDTTTARVVGEGTIDFREARVDLTLDPQAKVEQLYSLATPLEVSGSFEDFGPRLRPEELLGTYFRFATSPIVAPLSWLFFQPPPKDGADVCEQPMRWDGHDE